MASKKLFSLGNLYPSDFLKPGELPRSEPVELSLVIEDNGVVHLEHTAPKEAMWGKYWYRSSVTETMRKELKGIVDSITSIMKFNAGSIWVDVACNDGTLLSYVDFFNFIRIGIDPADDSFKEQSQRVSNLIIQDYFSAQAYKNSIHGNQKISVLTSIAMFYDLEKPEDFINDVYEVLDDSGVWVIQLSYTPLMIQQLAFDNICHEHCAYYWLGTLRNLLYEGGFDVMDCQLNDINGGSFRVYAMKKIADKTKFGTQPYRDVCEFRVSSLLRLEAHAGFDFFAIWQNFFACISNLKSKVVDFIISEKDKGKTIWGYGASTKGNTLLQWFGLDNTLLDGIAEKSEEKWGLKTVGTNIPIYSEDEMRKAKPDYLLILPWHFISEFIERENDYLLSGGKFIVPLPQFEIIEYKK